MNSKKIIVGVTGSIAAYKSCELVRLLKKQGHEVKVIMTAAAKQFVHPNTFATLSEHPVFDNIFDPMHSPMMHIDLGKWADLVIIAPASADCIAQLAHGAADTLLTCTCLVTKVKKYIAPAMNVNMWDNPLTQRNLTLLSQHDFHILHPESGEQACGDNGFGRMMEPEAIIKNLPTEPLLFKDQRILITAGPTIEKIDPARYISNFSSGKMGYALAEAFAAQGATVHLITGPTHIPIPNNCQVSKVTNAEEMLAVVLQSITEMDIFISAAAVADYTVTPHENKMKKSTDALTLSLQPTSDILKTVVQQYPDLFCVGFCAESNDLDFYAKKKLETKGCHAIIANLIHPDGFPFGSDNNSVAYITKIANTPIGPASKIELAAELARHIHSDFTQCNITEASNG